MNDEVSVAEAAEALNLSAWTVCNMCRLGKIPARSGRRGRGHGWRIPREWVDEYAKGNSIPNAAWLEWEREHGRIPTQANPTT